MLFIIWAGLAPWCVLLPFGPHEACLIVPEQPRVVWQHRRLGGFALRCDPAG